MKNLLADWRNLLPLAGIAFLAIIGIIVWLCRKPEDPNAMERDRRSYLNRIGRIAEGQVLEIVEHLGDQAGEKHSGLFGKPQAKGPSHVTRKLLHYSYSISGVSYETAQDITGLEGRVHLSRVAAGQPASIKYDPANPSNSILLADDWSGLH